MDDQLTPFATMTVAYITNLLVGYLKRAEWAVWITDQTRVINRGMAAIVTFIGTFGVVVACTGDPTSGWQCSMTIPPAEQLRVFFFRWAGTWALSHIMYEIGARRT